MKEQREKMNYLIIEAEKKCYARGHDMNWQRYSDYHAQAECQKCHGHVVIDKDHEICYGNLARNLCKERDAA